MAHCTIALKPVARYLTTAVAVAVVFSSAVASQVLAQEQLPWQSSNARSGPYSPPMSVGANDSYRPSGEGYGASPAQTNDAYKSGQGETPSDGGAGQPGDSSGSVDQYGGQETGPQSDSQRSRESGRGYGEPYSPPPQTYDDASRQPAPNSDPRTSEGFEQNEILGAGHRFFGGISGGIANGIEWAFKSQGRPNGYILGEDAGGAFILGLRYGEGTLFTKDAGEHRVYWQGPSLGYDAGGDGSKTMILVYNMRDPSEIYERFGGVQGAAYVVGGVSVQIQKYNDVTLAVIRSGIGLRLGANVGYMKYTRSPTWNPL